MGDSRVYQDLRKFIQMLDPKDIRTLVFFAARSEMDTFGDAVSGQEVFLSGISRKELMMKMSISDHKLCECLIPVL